MEGRGGEGKGTGAGAGAGLVAAVRAVAVVVVDVGGGDAARPIQAPELGSLVQRPPSKRHPSQLGSSKGRAAGRGERGKGTPRNRFSVALSAGTQATMEQNKSSHRVGIIFYLVHAVKRWSKLSCVFLVAGNRW